MQELSMRALDIEYRPPKLSLRDNNEAQPPLLLLFASPTSRVRTGDVDQAEVERILTFIYADLYPEGYSTVPSENDEYRRYCGIVRDQAVRTLRQPIQSLSCADLVSQVRNQRVKKSENRAKNTRAPLIASPTVGAT
jgi:hypothetical protein